MYTLNGKYTNALMTIDNFEESCIAQVQQFINHPAFKNNVVIQPDGHAGKGAVVGFCMEMSDKIIPNTIGVDIGCSVVTANIGQKLNITLKKLDEEIRKHIPMGINIHENEFQIGSLPKFSFKTQFPWKEANKEAIKFVEKYNKKFNTNYSIRQDNFDYRWFIGKCNQIGIKSNRAEMSIASLGGGNHYCELGKSETTGDIWCSIHTGSRNFGKCICEFHQNKAKEILNNKRNVVLKEKIEEITKNTKNKSKIAELINNAKENIGINFNFNIKGLEFLEETDAFEYLMDMVFAQKYAEFNRRQILNIIYEILGGIQPKEIIETIHNYIDFKDFIIRKGAIRSYKGEKMVIPLNMRDGTLICEGKSNPDWNCSAPHGAGRHLSRSAAKQSLDLEKFKKQMRGIYSTSVCKGTLDESPDSYKNSKMIEKAIEPTAIIVDKLKPILNIKDKNSGPSWKERREEKKRKQKRNSERRAVNYQKMKSKMK